MPLSQLLNTPCTITRKTETEDKDAHGNPVTEPVEVETVCELQQLQQRGEQEPESMGELSDTRWLVIFPPGTVITTAATVTVGGQEYEMVGDPWNARNPRTQTEHHVEATLRRTAGGDDA